MTQEKTTKEKLKDEIEDEVGEKLRNELIIWVRKYYYKNVSIRDIDIKAMNKVISFAYSKGYQQKRDEDIKIIKIGIKECEDNGYVVALLTLKKLLSKLKGEQNDN